MSDTVSQHLHQHLALSLFFILPILTGMQQHATCGINLHFPTGKYVQRLFLDLFAIYIAPSVKCLFLILSIFFGCFVGFLTVEFWESFIYIYLGTHPLLDPSKCFIPFCS